MKSDVFTKTFLNLLQILEASAAGDAAPGAEPNGSTADVSAPTDPSHTKLNTFSFNDIILPKNLTTLADSYKLLESLSESTQNSSNLLEPNRHTLTHSQKLERPSRLGWRALEANNKMPILISRF